MNRQQRRAMHASGLTVFIFFRKEGWYPVEIPPEQLDENIRLNPGTLKVEDMQGNVVWSARALAKEEGSASQDHG
jgi:hypothetical protein